MDETVKLRTDAPFTWAVRKENPQLRALVGKFHKAHGEGTLWGNMKFKEYFADGKFIRNPGRAKDASACGRHASSSNSTARAIRSTGCCSRQPAYQNRPRQPQEEPGRSDRHHAGHAGDGAALRVRVKNIEELERNIEAGTKYLRLMIDDYYEAEPMTRLDQPLFSLASYNADLPASRSCAEADKLQLDENVVRQRRDRRRPAHRGRDRHLRPQHLYYYDFRLSGKAAATFRVRSRTREPEYGIPLRTHLCYLATVPCSHKFRLDLPRCRQR